VISRQIEPLFTNLTQIQILGGKTKIFENEQADWKVSEITKNNT